MSGLDDLYREVILDHSRRPVGRGDVSAAAVTHHELNPTCGDEVTVGVTLSADDRITTLVWDGHGCSISTASASMLTELATGLPRTEAQQLIDDFRAMLRGAGEVEPAESLGDAAAFAGVARLVTRVKCAMLPWVALEACLRTAP
ncbi:Fe-S cluster assembly sulfur transfer protein SufU [Microbacterium sp. 10M-3C3]|jgi:nitrogen fixation NifU-like protein|uniref:Fe-S cluster assembly sulfur transfer protein SufU n=1 Tax=Microbacterium sp. 10M-3C3 TaxID=2483401 RepID=UPI000F633E68|nr:SUF system NifU family Fe-S cluster assembly protein [Microbacterium sp. 10M-3C3]